MAAGPTSHHQVWFADRVLAVMQGSTVDPSIGMSGNAVKDAIGRRGSATALHWLRETSSENAVQGGMTGNWPAPPSVTANLAQPVYHAGSWVRTAPGEPIISQWDNAS